MSEVLKPCPFCGSTDLHIEHMEGTVLHPAYAVICGYCSAQSNYVDRGAHVEVWNQRAIPEGSVLVPRELLLRARQLLDFHSGYKGDAEAFVVNDISDLLDEAKA